MQSETCPLCLDRDSATLLWQNDNLRVINVNDPNFPGYTRVIWHNHTTEMTDLSNSQRQHIMDAVWAVESALRGTLAPLKINIAQFGNVVPHLHWHIIPRWSLDTHFPDAIWAAPRPRTPAQTQEWQAFCRQQTSQLAAYHTTLKQTLNTI